MSFSSYRMAPYQPKIFLLVKSVENQHRSLLAVLPLLRNTKRYHGVEAFDLRGIVRHFCVLQICRSFWSRFFGCSAFASNVAVHEDVVPASTGFQP